MSRITIAIDGYSSCGKSTLAKALAARMNYTYIDSGAMYRSVTLYCLRNNIIVKSKFIPEEVIAILPKLKIRFEFNPNILSSETFLNDENVEKEIRTMEVANNVSKIATIKEVREWMVVIQREYGKDKGVVMDGRDIGSHVFPNAELKIFMTADAEVRIDRRLHELTSKGVHVDYMDVKKNLYDRDYQDTHRKANPLIRAKDAVVLDNSELDKEEQLEFVIKLINDLTLTKDTFSPSH